jgi:glycerol-3-phosphate dehydrogenase (NAD(P)+)
VAEGVQSCRSLLDLAGRAGVDVPIVQAVEAVCFRGLSPADMLRQLMSRTMKQEAY